MSLLRAFIAVEIPHEVHKAIENETAPLRAVLNKSLVRWVPTGNMHLTLKFLGDTSPANVDMLTQILSVEASQHPAFEIQFRGLGVFPNPRRPRVLYIGIQPSEELAALQRGIEAAAVKLGYPVEDHPFSPHLTIGRVKQNVNSGGMQKIRAALEGIEVGSLGIAPVNAVHLFKSDLKPSGAVYVCLHTAPLEC